MSVGNVARVVTVLAACVAAAGSASSSSSSNPDPAQGASAQGKPPPPQQMDAGRALGLWRSTFGAVKIEPDNTHGGLEAGNLQGVWVYQRQGQDVVGYFAGNLHGNVLQFHWQEPNNPPLVGEGYLVFDLQGRQYVGRWWSDKHDRVGDWNGWRQPTAQGGQARPGGPESNPYKRPQSYQQAPAADPADPADPDDAQQLPPPPPAAPPPPPAAPPAPAP